MYESNLPAGAENDPRAPWDEPDLCGICDKDYALNLAKKECKDPEDYDELMKIYHELINEMGLCKSCYLNSLY